MRWDIAREPEKENHQPKEFDIGNWNEKYDKPKEWLCYHQLNIQCSW